MQIFMVRILPILFLLGASSPTPGIPSFGQSGQLGGNLGETAEYCRQPYANLIDSMRGFHPAEASYCGLDAVVLSTNGLPLTDCIATLATDGALAAGEVYDVYTAGRSNAVTAYNGCTVEQLTADTARLTVNGAVVSVSVKGGLSDLEIIPHGTPRGTRWRTDHLDYLNRTGTGLRLMKMSGAEHMISKSGDYLFRYTGPLPSAANGAISNQTNANGVVSFIVTVPPYASAPVIYLPGTTIPSGISVTRIGDPGYVVLAFADASRITVRQAENPWSARVKRTDRLASSYQGKFHRGMPIEDQVNLANTLYALNPKNDTIAAVLPWCLDDAAQTDYFTYWRDHCNPAIQLIFARVNEAWNYNYDYELECRTAGISAGNTEPARIAYDGQSNPNSLRERYVAYITHQMGERAAAVFGSEFGMRCRIGYEYQLGGEAYLGDALQYLEKNFPGTTGIHAVAGAFYTNVEKSWIRGRGRTPEEIYNMLETNVVQGLTERRTKAVKEIGIACSFGKTAYCYESGIHIHWNTTGSDSGDTAPDVDTGTFYESDYARQHVRHISATLAELGIGPDFHYSMQVGTKPYSQQLDGNKMWYATDSRTLLRPKAAALEELQTQPMPVLQAAFAAPGPLSAQNPSWYDSELYNGATEASKFNYSTATGNRFVNGRTTDPVREIRWGFWVEHSATYAMTLYAVASASTPTTVTVDGTNVQIVAVSGGWPAAAVAVAQPSVQLTLDRGWHSIIVSASPAINEQWGVNQIDLSSP